MKIALISLAKGSGCPPIGLVYLATYLKEHLDVEVEIIDANWDDTKNYMMFEGGYSKFDVVGISAMTVHYGEGNAITRSQLSHSSDEAG